MRFATWDQRKRLVVAAVLAGLNLLNTRAQDATNMPYASELRPARFEGGSTTNDAVYQIDLPTTLRLAGARNLDIQIARASLNEAQANHRSAIEQFFPWVSPGLGYHRRDGVAQAVPSGVISEAHFQSYSPGASLAAQMPLGDAIYNSLAARQLLQASGQGLEAQRQDAVLLAAQGYFDLVRSKALVEVVREAIRVSQDYQEQLRQAVVAGIAFKGDELRVQSQTEHDRIALEQAIEQERLAVVNLSQTLHLDSRIELAPRDNGLEPQVFFTTNLLVNSLVEQALSTRPELKQSQAYIAAARDTKNGAVYGPLIPSLGAQIFGGGLGGGPDNGPSNLGPEGDYSIGLSWRIGPGGLFDAGRIEAGKARLAAARLSDAKLKDAIISQVVAALVHVNSTATQIQLAERNLATATETLRLTRERKQYGVGIVLEDIEAQQALTQARSDYVSAVANNSKAQYALRKAAGALTETE